jgi:hypothetical protein
MIKFSLQMLALIRVQSRACPFRRAKIVDVIPSLLCNPNKLYKTNGLGNHELSVLAFREPHLPESRNIK